MGCIHNGIVFKPDGIHELSGHAFVKEQTAKNVTVEILRCKICGKVSIGWRRQHNTIEIE